MANKEIHELAASVAELQDTDLVAGVIGTAAAIKYTGLQLRGVEKGEREAQDNVIEASCGLETDGSWAVPSWDYVNAANLTAQGEGNTNKAAIHLLDTQLALVSETGLLSTEVVLSQAEILSLHVAPVTLLTIGSTIGKWNAINVVNIFALNNYNSSAYAIAGGGTLRVFYGASYSAAKQITTLPEPFIESAVNYGYGADTSAAVQIGNGESVAIDASSAVTAGDGEITITVFYTIARPSL